MIRNALRRASTATSCRLINDGRALEVEIGGRTAYRFHAFWLRDNAASTRLQSNGQRTITVADLPRDERVRHADVEPSGEFVSVQFASGEASRFPTSWLERHAYDRPHAQKLPGWVAEHVELWDSALASKTPRDDLHALQTDPSRLQAWLRGVLRFGCAMLRGGRVEDGALFDVINLFGHVRETNYGRKFEVKTVPEPENLAYSAIGLQAHTDNPYRDPAPTLQLLYCLENSAEGGESTLVDGFAAAARLRKEDPEGFQLLTSYPANFAFEQPSNSVILHARKPMISLGPDGLLEAISFNNRSVAPLSLVPFERMEGYYRAYARFAQIVDDPQMAVRFKLAPGEGFIVDNRRVLHGRTGFGGTSGSRWMQGCYADVDGLYSTLLSLDARASSVVLPRL